MIKLSNLIPEWDIPSNKWVDIDLKRIAADDMRDMWTMYTTSYLQQGLDLSASNWHEMQAKYKAAALKDIDYDHIPDCFIVYKQTPFGNKVSLLGTNGKSQAKSDVVHKVVDLAHTAGWYIEASKKMEDILRGSGAPVVTDPKKIQAIVGPAKHVEVLDNGYYTRELSKVNKRITKRIYGKPR
jgi:hypothetical protein